MFGNLFIVIICLYSLMVGICKGQLKATDDNFILGVCTHYAQQWEKYNLSLPMVKQAGIESIRDELPWGNVEKIKGQLALSKYYDEYMRSAIDMGIEPMIILDYANKFYDSGGYPSSELAQQAFCRYAEFIARRYKGKVKIFEVWNEWDNGCGMKGRSGGSPEVYAKLLKKVYKQLKAINPECIVLGGAVSGAGIGDKTEGWVKRILQAGALDYMDGFSIHPYTYSSACETYFNSFPQSVDKLEKILRKYNRGKDKPIYITEMGWTTSSIGNDTNKQAAYLARFLLLAKTRKCIKGVWIYNLTDCVGYEGHWWTPQAAQRNFGIIRQDYTPKSAYWAVRDLSGLIRRGRFIGRMNIGDSSIFAMQFELADKQLIAIWTTKENGLWRIIFESKDGNKRHPVLYQKVGHGRPVRINWNKNLFSVYIDNSPILLEGNFDNLKVNYLRWIPIKQKSNIVKWSGAAPVCFVKYSPNNIRIDGNANDWKENKLVVLNYQKLMASRKGDNDLSGQVGFSWDKKNLYILVKVTDDIQYQPYRSSAIWAGDSLQIGFIASCSAKSDYFEVGFASDKNGNVERAYWHVPRRLAEDADKLQGLLRKIKVAIKRKDNKTIYELAIPNNSEFLPKLVAGASIRMAIVVNDNDGAGRKGYLHWASGIASGKEPNEYGKLIFLSVIRNKYK